MKIKESLKKAVCRFLGLFPSSLPVGMTAFHKWADSIISLAGLDTVPSDDQKFVLASLIMHLGPTECYKPKEYFLRALRKAAASQVASGAFQEIKAAQAKKAEEAK